MVPSGPIENNLALFFSDYGLAGQAKSRYLN